MLKILTGKNKKVLEWQKFELVFVPSCRSMQIYYYIENKSDTYISYINISDNIIRKKKRILNKNSKKYGIKNLKYRFVRNLNSSNFLYYKQILTRTFWIFLFHSLFRFKAWRLWSYTLSLRQLFFVSFLFNVMKK